MYVVKHQRAISLMALLVGIASFMAQLFRGLQAVADKFWSSAAAVTIVALFFLCGTLACFTRAFSSLDPDTTALYFKLGLTSCAIMTFLAAVSLADLSRPQSKVQRKQKQY